MNKSIELIEKKFNLNLLDIKDKYPIPIGQICKMLNVYIVFDTALNSNCFGNIIKHHNDCTIKINKNHSAQTNIFTIAHGLGHYIKNYQNLHINKMFIKEKNIHYTKEEAKVSEFASELLMPEEKFYNIYKEFNGDVKRISNFFMVNDSAIYFRTAKLGLAISTYE